MANLPIFEQYFMVKPNSLAFVQSPMLCLLTNCAKYTTNDHPMAPLSLAQGIFTGDRLAGKNPKGFEWFPAIQKCLCNSLIILP